MRDVLLAMCCAARDVIAKRVIMKRVIMKRVIMPPERFELPTPWFEARCSRPLSYDGV